MFPEWKRHSRAKEGQVVWNLSLYLFFIFLPAEEEPWLEERLTPKPEGELLELGEKFILGEEELLLREGEEW